MTALLPRARFRDVALGRARLLGTRLSKTCVRGVFSPIEARVHLGLEYVDLQDEERRLLVESSSIDRLGIVVRAVSSGILGGNNREVAPVSLFEIEPAALSVNDAVDFIFEKNTKPRRIYFAHPHALNISLVDAEQEACLRDADAVFADGIGVRLGTRLLGGNLPSNLNGTDMFPLLCKRAAQTGRPLVLVGSKTEIVEECARRSQRAHPNLTIPIVSHGYLDEAASRMLATQIEKLENPLVLVGMGSPIQEKWAKRHLSNSPGVTVLTVGGLFDFYSGRIPRAPTAWRELGLEWLYRLIQEPTRMARRYLVGNPFFLVMIAYQRIGLCPRTLARLPGAARLLGVARRQSLSP